MLSEKTIFNFIAIVAAALRDHPQNELFLQWLRGPKPALTEARRMLFEISGLYWCGPKLHALMIRAGQDLIHLPWESSSTWSFYKEAYQAWYESQDAETLNAVSNEETLRGFLDPILPEQQFRELGEKFPTVQAVWDLCNAHNIKHVVISPRADGGARSYSVLTHLSDETDGRDLWVKIWHNSSHGWLVRYADLVAAAGFSPQPASAT